MHVSDTTKIYQQLLTWATNFTHQPTTKPVDGAYYDMPETVVYTNTIQKLTTGGRLEVNITEPIAHDAFHWRVEITIDDKEQALYKHVLLQLDGQIVETYGKQVIPVDEAGAEAILQLVQRLTEAG